MHLDFRELGDRMKAYENRPLGHSLLPGVPAIVRLDGRAFHSFTKGLDRPFDERFIELMKIVTIKLVGNTNAIIGYTQSDEITLVLDNTDIHQQMLFGGKPQKIISNLASMATFYFNWHKEILLPPTHQDKFATFDCRLFEAPSRSEAVNNLIWREMDAERNSIHMAARSMFSHTALSGKSQNEQLAMMYDSAYDWHQLPREKRIGTVVKRLKRRHQFSADEIERLPPKHHARQNPDGVFERTSVETVNCPSLRSMDDPVGFVFESVIDEERPNIESL